MSAVHFLNMVGRYAGARTRTNLKRARGVGPKAPNLRLKFKGKTMPGRKRGGTRTMTKRLNQNSRMNTLQTGSVSNSRYGFSKLSRFQYKLLKNDSPIDFFYNEAGNFKADYGLQKDAIVSQMYTYPIMYEVGNQLGLLQGAGTNPSLQVSLGFGATNSAFAHSLCSWECVSDTYLTNSSNTPCVLTLYDVVARRPGTATGRENPVAQWGLGIYEGNTNGTNTQFVIGATPFQSPSYCHNFKIIKVTHIQLAEGQVHRHVFKHTGKMNWQSIYDIAYAAGSGDKTSITPMLSAYTHAVVHGTPLPSVSNPTTEVTTSPIKINYVTKYDYTFHKLPNPNHYNLGKNTLLTSLTGFGEAVQMYGGATQFALTV